MMQAQVVRNAQSKIVGFGPHDGNVDLGLPDGCTKAIEPDYEAILAEWKAQQAPLQYQHLRANAYPPASDYLDGIVKGDAVQVQAYIAACLAVKAKYPKP